ncbi:MAG: sigma-70 family RNA polymerase sigma factor [bacterium]|nr:sigma-70 family RNA polymerase sigma factor [bacterium]
MNNYSNKKLSELIELAKSDDNDAISELISRYQDKIYEMFIALKPADDIFDLTQEALFRMSRSIKKLKKPERFHSWLNKIVHNLFYDTLRRKRHSCPISEPNCDNENSAFGECIIDKKKTPDENTLYCELKTKINIAIEKLPALFRTIVLLREVEGLSYGEIADLTNLNVGTVKSRLARARVILKKELEPYIK